MIFLKSHKHLNKNIILLGLSGSYAYGTDNESSDLDIRGVALNLKEEIPLGQDFNQFVDVSTDTTIYSFNKMIQLLVSSNPNIIEILGLSSCLYHISLIRLLFLKGVYVMKTLNLILKNTIYKIKLRIKKELDFSHENFLKDYNRNYSKYSSNYRLHNKNFL